MKFSMKLQTPKSLFEPMFVIASMLLIILSVQ